MIELIDSNVKTLVDLPFRIGTRYPNRSILRRCKGDAFIDTSGHDFFEHVRDRASA